MALNKIWARRNVQSVRSSLVGILPHILLRECNIAETAETPVQKSCTKFPTQTTRVGSVFPQARARCGRTAMPRARGRNAPRVLKSAKRPPVRAFVCHNHFFHMTRGTLLFQKEWTPFWGTAPMGPIRPCARMTAEPSSMLSTLEPNLRCADQRRSTRCLASRDSRRPPTFALFYFSPVNGEGTARWRCGSCFCAVRCSGRRR